MSEPIYFVNGKFIPSSKALLHVSDLSIMRGYGVFDFLITYNNKPFLLDNHLNRLGNSAKIIGLKLPYNKTKIKKFVLKTLNKNSYKQEKAIRIVVTGGLSLAPDYVKAKDNASLVITVDPKHLYPQEYYLKGVKVITYNHKRPYPEVKSINYITALKAQAEARAKNAIEAIYVYNSLIYEATTSNLFAVINNTLITNIQDVLPGITSSVVQKLAPKIVKFISRPIKISEIKNFSEAFITASNKEVMPVIRINDQKIGDGKVGLVTKKIIKLFKEYTKNYDLHH